MQDCICPIPVAAHWLQVRLWNLLRHCADWFTGSAWPNPNYLSELWILMSLSELLRQRAYYGSVTTRKQPFLRVQHLYFFTVTPAPSLSGIFIWQHHWFKHWTGWNIGVNLWFSLILQFARDSWSMVWPLLLDDGLNHAVPGPFSLNWIGPEWLSGGNANDKDTKRKY